ncbi:MAG: hypothetical protein ABWK05_07660 [Pyrobaculum sp.]
MDPSTLDYSELLRAVRRAGYDIYRESAHIALAGFRPEETAAVERAARIWGVFSASVNPAAGVLYVEYNPLEVTAEEVAKAVEEACYKVRGVERGKVDVDIDRRVVDEEVRELKRRLILAIPFTALLIASMFFPMTTLRLVDNARTRRGASTGTY